jgi:hypothetical protein
VAGGSPLPQHGNPERGATGEIEDGCLRARSGPPRG